MIEKTPTEDEYEPCEFHVAIKNKLYTHEIVIKRAIPTVDEYEIPGVRLEQALKSYDYSMWPLKSQLYTHEMSINFKHLKLYQPKDE